MSRPTKLSEKHWQALDLLSKGKPRKEVAVTLGWKQNHVDQLCLGNVQQAGGVASLFKTEYIKGQAKAAEDTQKLIKLNLKKAHDLMGTVLDEISQKKKKTAEDKKIISMYSNAIAKSQPSVNIKNLSYSYTKGLSAEELVHEFTRLKGVAESSFNREAVPSSSERRAGELLEVDE